MIAERAQPSEDVSAKFGLGNVAGWLLALALVDCMCPLSWTFSRSGTMTAEDTASSLFPCRCVLASTRFFQKLRQSARYAGTVADRSGIDFGSRQLFTAASYIEAYTLALLVAGYVLLRFGRALCDCRISILLLLFVVRFRSLSSIRSHSGSAASVRMGPSSSSNCRIPITQQGNSCRSLADGGGGRCLQRLQQALDSVLDELVYGDMFPLSPIRRLLLSAAALPIALLANILRITIILLVSILQRRKGLHVVHDRAELMGCGNRVLLVWLE